MSEIQFIPMSQQDAARKSFTAIITVTTDQWPLLTRVLDSIFSSTAVQIDTEAPGFTQTFYGWEKDVWTTPLMEE